MFETNLMMTWYKYGRRVFLFGFVVALAFLIGWFLHKENFFAHVGL